MKKFKNLIFAIVFLSIITVCLIMILNKQSTVATVYKDGKAVKTFNLEKIEESFTEKIDEHNSVLVEKGKISMYYADCPDKLCINQGSISGGGYPIVCLPNKVVIRIEDGEYDSFVSAK